MTRVLLPFDRVADEPYEPRGISDTYYDGIGDLVPCLREVGIERLLQHPLRQFALGREPHALWNAGLRSAPRVPAYSHDRYKARSINATPFFSEAYARNTPTWVFSFLPTIPVY
jgi:hypothetical protein